MPQKLHGRATTTHAIRKEIQNSKESIAKLAKRYGITEVAARKWKNRTTVQDPRPGPESRSKSPTPQQEAIAITFRKHT